MKKLFLLSVLILLLGLNIFSQKAAAGKPDPAKGVHDAFDRLIEGIEQVDVDKVMGVYDKSDRLLIFNNNGTATLGWDQVHDNVSKTYPKLSNVSLDITGLRIEMLGKTAAYVSCKWKQTQDNEGKQESASGRMTLVFRLIGKQWKIVHRHTSPDNPDANRPLFPSERETP